MYDRAYYEANRERINQNNRECHARHRELRNAKRRAGYAMRREVILEKQKADRMPCPFCRLTFRRVYVPKHVQLRHIQPGCLPCHDGTAEVLNSTADVSIVA